MQRHRSKPNRVVNIKRVNPLRKGLSKNVEGSRVFAKSRVHSTKFSKRNAVLVNGKNVKDAEGTDRRQESLSTGVLMGNDRRRSVSKSFRRESAEAPIADVPVCTSSISEGGVGRQRALPKCWLKFLDLLGERKWFEVLPLLDATHSTERQFLSVDEAVVALKSEAQTHIEALSNYVNCLQTKASKEEQWLRSVVSKGTTSDRVAAGVLLVQQCPIVQTVQLRRLLEQMAKLNRTGMAKSSEAIKDLMINDLLPVDRKLNFFADNPTFHSLCTTIKPQASNKKKVFPRNSSGVETGSQSIVCRYNEAQLVVLWFEDVLKALYINLVMSLAAGCKDTLPFFRQRCCKYAYELLTHSPEQEKGLLTILVSQLVEAASKKDASTAAYFLQQLLLEHPPMKKVLAQYVGDALSKRLSVTTVDSEEMGTLYRPVLFLTSFKYSKKDPDLPKFMISIFLRIFDSLVEYFKTNTLTANQRLRMRQQNKRKKRKLSAVKKRGSLQPAGEHLKSSKAKESVKPCALEASQSPNCRLLKAVLDGVNRALPYIPASYSNDLSLNGSTLRSLVLNIKNKTVKIALLSLLYSFNNIFGQDNTEFYMLLYKATKDVDLLQASNRVSLLSLLRSIQSNPEPHLAIPLALSRRLLQTASHSQLPCVQLYLLKGLIEYLARQFVWAGPVLLQSDAALTQDEKEEVFKDCVDDDDDGDHTDPPNTAQSVVEPTRDVQTLGVGHGVEPRERTRYNALGRDPRSDNAEVNHLWEINLLRCSVYPPVAEYARAIYAWGLQHRGEKRQWAAAGTAVVPPPSLDNLIPLAVKAPKEESDVAYLPSVETLSNTAVLDMLASCAGDSAIQNCVFKAKRNRAHKRSQAEDCLTDTMCLPEYWAKKRVFPHERFLHKYFTDEYVVLQKRRKKPKLTEEENDIQDNDGAGDMEDDEEDRNINALLDDVMAREMQDDQDSLQPTDNDDVDDFDAFADLDEVDELDVDHDSNGGAVDDDDTSDFGESFSEALEKHSNKATANEKRRRKKRSTGAVFADAEEFSQYL